jgi:uncharacterized delta-60 repeat protein
LIVSVAIAGSLLVAIEASAGATTEVIAAGGTPATERIMDRVLDLPRMFDIHAQQNPALEVAADSFCDGASYSSVPGSGSYASPATSDAGRNALRDSQNGVFPFYPEVLQGCLDIARSGLGPRPVSATGDRSSFEYYAFAMDAVTWATSSLAAPAQLTLLQLRDIYDCDITDWSGVPGGGSGPIQRALPPLGSDTRTIFVSDVLGLPTDYEFPANANCPSVATVPENDGLALTTSADLKVQFDQYILPYSAGVWVYQANNRTNPTLDRRGGVRPGGIERPTGASCPSAGTSPLAQVADPALPVRWVGSSFRLNDATVGCGLSIPAATSDGRFDTTLTTSSAGTFTSDMIGLTVEGATVNDGTVITAIGDSGAGPGSLAVISPGARAGGSAPLTVGIVPVDEQDTDAVAAQDAAVLPGVHYLYNVVDFQEPSYAIARGLVGFAAWDASPLCSGTFASSIEDSGYIPLASRARTGTRPVTCRLTSPSSVPNEAAPLPSAAATLDPSFGSRGEVSMPDDDKTFATGRQSDGSIVIFESGPEPLVRILPSGELDTEFSATASTALSGLTVNSVVVMPNDSIIVAAAETAAVDPCGHMLMFRLRPDGTADPAAGPGGQFFADASHCSPNSAVLTLDHAGRILVSYPRSPSNSCALIRFSSDGVLDEAFSDTASSGLLEAPQPGSCNKVMEGDDDSLLILTYDMVVRLLPDGERDSSYGTGSLTISQGSYDRLIDAAPTTGGKIILGSTRFVPGDGWHFWISRLTSSGDLDSTFGDHGSTLVPSFPEAPGETSSFPSNDRLSSVLVTPAGEIIVLGTTVDGLAVARLAADGSSESGLLSGGRSVLRVGEYPYFPLGLLAEPDVLFAFYSDNGHKPSHLARIMIPQGS